MLYAGDPSVGYIGVAVHKQRLAVGGYDLAVILHGPAVHGFVKCGVTQVVVILGKFITQVAVSRCEHRLEHLYLRVDALPSTAQPEVAHGIQVGQQFAETVKPSEKVMVYTFQVAEPTLQIVVGVGFHAVHDIHVRGGGAYRDNLDQSLSVRIGGIVNTGECVAFGYDIDCRSAVCRYKVFELHPVKAVLSVRPASAAGIGYDQLVMLGDIMAVLLRGHAIVLLHHDIVVRTERVVKLAVTGIEIDAPGSRVVMVHLHHAGKDTVVVLSQQL